MHRILAGLLVVVMVAGCTRAPSTEGESQRYNNKMANANRYMNEWPAYRPFLEEELKATKSAWADAQNQKGEAQLAAMQAVNRSFGPFYGNFFELDRQIQQINSDTRRIMGTDYDDDNLRMEVDNIVGDVRRSLGQSQITEREAALVLLQGQVDRLRTLGVRTARYAQRLNEDDDDDDGVTIKVKTKKKKKKAKIKSSGFSSKKKSQPVKSSGFSSKKKKK